MKIRHKFIEISKIKIQKYIAMKIKNEIKIQNKKICKKQKKL